MVGDREPLDDTVRWMDNVNDEVGVRFVRVFPGVVVPSSDHELVFCDVFVRDGDSEGVGSLEPVWDGVWFRSEEGLAVPVRCELSESENLLEGEAVLRFVTESDSDRLWERMELAVTLKDVERDSDIGLDSVFDLWIESDDDRTDDIDSVVDSCCDGVALRDPVGVLLPDRETVGREEIVTDDVRTDVRESVFDGDRVELRERDDVYRDVGDVV